jgi:hypothetical protein
MANASGYNPANRASVFSSFCGRVSESIIAGTLRTAPVCGYGVFTPYTDGSNRLIVALDSWRAVEGTRIPESRA